MPARSAPSPRYPSGSTTAPPSIGRPGCTPPRAVVRHLVGARARTRGELRRRALPAARLLARCRAPGDRPRHSVPARPVHVRRARDRTPRESTASRRAHAAGPGRRSRSPRRAGRCAGRRRGGPVNASVTLPKGILSGVRILDFTWKTVGPWAPRLLTHFGAEVIHVERVGSWDDHRYAAHPSPIVGGPQKAFTSEQGTGPLHGGGHADGKKPYYNTPYF